MKKLYFFSFLYILSVSGFSYAYLQFSDPRNLGKSGAATIEAASLNIRPAGTYFHYDLELTFSASGFNYTVNDTLEVLYYFDMPAGVAFTDSWLWVGDEPVQAGIYDISTARNTYENIVNRRKDPSILYKKANNQYELRIFPMAGHETRKVRLSYLVPVEWYQDFVKLPLTTDILSVSYIPLNKLSITIENSDTFKFPLGIEPSGSINGNRVYELRDNEIYTITELTFRNPMQNGVYFSASQVNGENYYQAAILPSHFFKVSQHRKVIFAVDYDSSTTTFSKSFVVNQFKSKILLNLSPADSVQLIYPTSSGQIHQSVWARADSLNIIALTDHLTGNLHEKSDLAKVLSKAYQTGESEKGLINLVLLTSSNRYSDYISGSSFADSLSKKHRLIPTYISTFGNMKVFDQAHSYYYYYSPYSYSYGLQRLATMSRGLYLTLDGYYSYYYNSSVSKDEVKFQNNLNTIFKRLEDNSGHLQVFPALDNGFVYSVYGNNGNGAAPMFKPYVQIGKFSGSLPITLHISGETNDTVHFSKIHLNAPIGQDTLLKTMWTAAYIASHEGNVYEYNPNREQIVKRSIENRVLSFYTAFLALEPGMKIQPCENCTDDPWAFTDFIGVTTAITGLKDPDGRVPEKPESTEVTISPNPADEYTVISSVLENAYSGAVTVKIFNLSGEIVKVIDSSTGKGTFQVKWDTNDHNGSQVPAGIYLVQIEYGNKRKLSRAVITR